MLDCHVIANAAINQQASNEELERPVTTSVAMYDQLFQSECYSQ